MPAIKYIYPQPTSPYPYRLDAPTVMIVPGQGGSSRPTEGKMFPRGM